jgi:hypothetical protein
MLLIPLLVVLAAEPAFKKVDEVDGITVESRSVEGSSFTELRFSTVAARTVAALCTEAYGTGAFDPTEPDLKSREILFEAENERVVFDRMTPAIVSPRSYAVRIRREWSDGACHLIFGAANELAPPEEKGWVRVTKVHGSWTMEPLEGGKSKLTYVIFTDPGGAIPAFFVEGSRRKLAVTWVKRIIARAATSP